MTTALIWDERFAWHDAGLASTNAWVEPYAALDRPECKRRVWSLLRASGLARHLELMPARQPSSWIPLRAARGAKALTGFLQHEFEPFPGATESIEDLVAERDRVTVETACAARARTPASISLGGRS